MSSGRFSNLPSIPPSTMIVCPLTWPEMEDDATMTIWLAISRAEANFFNGVLRQFRVR